MRLLRVIDNFDPSFKTKLEEILIDPFELSHTIDLGDMWMVKS